MFQSAMKPELRHATTRSSMANCNYKIVFDSDSIYRIPNFLSHTYFYNTDIPFYQEKFQKFSKFFFENLNFFIKKSNFSSILT